MPKANRSKTIIRGATILAWLSWMGVMFYFSSKAVWGGARTLSLLEALLAANPALLESSLQQLEMLNLAVRKLAHLTEYGILTWLGFYVWHVGIQQLRNRALLLTLLSSVIYAIADEIHQSFVPGRTALLSDVLVDALGSLIALWLIQRSLPQPTKSLRASNEALTELDQKTPSA